MMDKVVRGKIITMKLVFLILNILFLLVGCTPTNENLAELTGETTNTRTVTNNTNIGNQAFTFSPSSYDFGNRAVGAAAISTTITVTNSSSSPMYLSGISGGNAPFSVTGDTCVRSPFAIAVNGACTITVSFQPSSGGLFNMTLAMSYGTSPATNTSYSAVMGISGSGVGALSFAGIDSISDIYSTQLKLNWTHVAGALTYFVIRVNGDGSSTLIANVTPPTATYIISGLTASTSYKFWVRASDTLGALDTNTNIVTTATNNTPPSPDIATISDYVYPSTALTVGNTLSVNSDDSRTGSATDAGIAYSCYYDTTIDGVVASATACTNLNSLNVGTATFSSTAGIFTWIPSPGAIGFYEVKVIATDLISALTDNSVFKVDVVPSYSTSNLKTSLMASFSNITYLQTGSATTWEDVTANANDGTLENFTFLGSDGWFGANTIASPHRLVFDGTGRVDLSNILNGNTRFATTSWITPGTTTAGISAVYQSSALDIRTEDTGNGRYQINFGKTYRDTIMSQSPMAYYEFNETSGTTMTDSSGNGYNGTFVNGAAYGQTNCPLNGNNKNACVDFDGVNDYAYVSTAAINAIFDPGSSYTISFWYYPEELPVGAWHDLFDRAYTTHVSPYYNLSLRMQNNRQVTATLHNTTGAPYVQSASAVGALNLFQWTHFAIVVNNAGTNIELFLNGVSQGVSGAPAGTYANYGHPVYIGTNKNLIGASYSSDGKMDDVAIFNSALSSAQVLAQYNAGINYNNGAGLYPYNAVMQDRPVALYRLAESSGTIAYDSSGNGNHGTYVGAVTLGATGSYNPTDSNTATTLSGTGYIKVADQTPFNFLGAFTLETWIKGTDQSGWWHAISRWGSTNVRQRYALCTETNGYPYFGILKSNVGNGITGTTDILDGSWHHVVGTNDGSVLKLYVDGAFVTASAIGVGGATDTDSVYLMLGASDNGAGGNQMLPNSLDEVALYDYALTNSQVKAHYTQSSYNFCKTSKSYIATESEFISALYDGTLVTVYAKNIEQCSFKPTSAYTSTPNVVLGSRSDTAQSSPWVGSMMDFKLYATNNGTNPITGAGIQAIYDNTEVKYKTRPDSVAGMLFWHRPEDFISSAHGSTVSTWSDSSYNSYHMTNSAAAGTKPTVMARAANNYPALLFSNAQYLDMSGATMDSTTSHTFFIVHNPNDATGALGYFIYTGGGLILGEHNGVTAVNGFNDGAWKSFVLQSGWQIQTWTFDGGGTTATVHVNGTIKYNAAYTPTPISGTKYFGANSGTQFLKAQVAEVIGYTGALNSTNRQAMECYLAKKFNIPLSYTCTGN